MLPIFIQPQSGAWQVIFGFLALKDKNLMNLTEWQVRVFLLGTGSSCTACYELPNGLLLTEHMNTLFLIVTGM